MFHTLHGDGGVEVGEFFISLADAISFGLGGVFNVGHAPGGVAHQLEGRAALALLVAFKLHIVIFILYLVWAGQFRGRGGKDAGCTSFFLDEHVVESVGRHIVDVGIDGGISPVHQQAGLGKTCKGGVGIGVEHAVVLVFCRIKQ